MTTNIFQDIKDRVDLRDLVRHYGLDVNRGVRLICFAKRQPAARFTTSATLALKSMKIITTASAVGSMEIMLTFTSTSCCSAVKKKSMLCTIQTGTIR